MATKLLAAYSKLIGREYLKDIIYPLIQNLIQNPVPCEVCYHKMLLLNTKHLIRSILRKQRDKI